MQIKDKRKLVENRYKSVPRAVEPGGRLRLTGVSYLNAQPILYGLLQGLCEERMHVELAEPAELGRRLLEDEVDAALAPVAVLANHGGLEIVPGIAIGCDGPVRSVVLVGERPIAELEEVLLDASSRTSVVLARLVLKQLRGGSEPRYCSRAPKQITEEVAGPTGALLIGDAALEARGRFAYELDLGQAWKEMTGLPFVFAVWVARPGLLEPSDVAALQQSLAEGLAARAEIARSWARGRGGDPAAHLSYLSEAIRYPLDERALAGLREFLQRAAAHKLLPPAELRFIGQPAPEPLPHRRSIDDLLEYAAAGGRLDFEDAMRLGSEADVHELGLAADARRKALHPDGVVTYIVDRNINYTNVCTTACRFCAFYRPVGHAEGYVLSREQLSQKIEETVAAGGIQILLQGGLNPALHLEWYEELFRFMKANFPIKLHALSPEEIWHLVRLEDLSIEEVLRRLREAGMDSLPGGGAEVLTDRVRSKIAKAKCTSAEWLEVMRVAHRLGMRTTATMMFGTADTLADRVLHMLKVRDLQDETGGFTAFISWDYQHDQGTRAVAGETGTVLYLRTQALSRLVLDNIDNIQSSWVTQGPGVGQLGLRYGANDMGSTMFEENVVSSAGTTFAMDAAQIERHARASGFRVAQRNMRYERLTVPC
jgi:cyclic dehypoxanthinyl futalosine synthase